MDKQKQEAMQHFENKKLRCPDCGVRLSKEKDSFICWICHNKFELKKRTQKSSKENSITFKVKGGKQVTFKGRR